MRADRTGFTENKSLIVGDHQNVAKPDHVEALDFMLKTVVGLEYLS
jgi:hypothetical protein